MRSVSFNHRNRKPLCQATDKIQHIYFDLKNILIQLIVYTVRVFLKINAYNIPTSYIYFNILLPFRHHFYDHTQYFDPVYIEVPPV